MPAEQPAAAKTDTLPKVQSTNATSNAEVTDRCSSTSDVAVQKQLRSPYTDLLCNPLKPKIISFHNVSAAAYRIKESVMRTPCTLSHISEIAGMEIYFKKEYLQYTGSFKERGVSYTLLMLPEDKRRRGVITASARNHALALSYQGSKMDIPVTVVMPSNSPIMIVQQCKVYGAQVVIRGDNLSEAKDYAMALVSQRNLTYINGHDHPDIIAGHGTVGLEIVEQVDDVDAIIVPIGGGGLIAGTVVAVKAMRPEITVIGVEPERCPCFTEALKAGRPVYTDISTSLADGLAVPSVGVNAFATSAKLVDKVVKVSEEMIAIAILRLVEMEKAIVEGAGAAGLAAILAGLLPELKGKRVVVPLCGGNIDTTVLGRCLERGLAVDGRLVKFSVTVSDRPGGISDLTRFVSDIGVSMKDIIHERAWLKRDVFSVQVKVVAETRDREHAVLLEKLLRERYEQVTFNMAAD